MRNKIFGVIGVLWGAAIIVNAFARGGAEGSSSYAAGSYTAIAFGVALLVAGGWTLAKRGRA